MSAITQSLLYNTENAITAAIPAMINPLHAEGKKWIYLFLILNFVVLLMYRIIEMVMNPQARLSPAKLLVQLTISTILILSFQYLMMGVVGLSNYIADTIFSVDEIQKFIETLFPEKDPDVSFINFKIKQLFGAILKYASLIVFFCIGIWRYLLLSLFFLISPIVFCLSLNPLYGTHHLIQFMKNTAQIASWPIIISAFCFVLDAYITNVYSNMALFSIDQIEFMVIASAFLWGTLKVPFLAQMLFDGANMSSLTTGTGIMAGLLKGGISTALNFGIGKPAGMVGKGAKTLGGLGKEAAMNKVIKPMAAKYRQ